MKLSIGFLSSLLLLLFSTEISARKDVGEYWKKVMKDQAMLDCYSSNDNKEQKPFTKDFEPGPNISVYDNDIKPIQKKSVAKVLESGPIIRAYDNDIKLVPQKSSAKDFESGPDEIKPVQEKSFVKDFEPGPNISVYGD